jgi:type IV pilus assembly protein PilF
MRRTARLARIGALLGGIVAVGAAPLGCASTHPPDEARSASPAPAAARSDRLDGTEQLNEYQRRARMHYQMAIDHLRQGRTPQAIAELLDAERFDPNYPDTELALAEAYREQGRLAETEAHLLRALQIDPHFHEAQLNLAAYYIQVERYADAVRLLQTALDDPTFPAPWRALTNLGWAEYRLGQLDGAYEHLQRAVDFRPDYWPARLDLGILEAERGKTDAAIQDFQHVLESRPGPLAEAEARFRLAKLLLSRGDRKAAVRHLMAASALEPSGPWSKRSAEALKTLQ